MATFKTFVTCIALAFGLAQVANASAVKRWGVPLPACTPATPFVYAGCFSDTGSTDALEYRSELDFNNMTIEACVDFCKGNDFRYAGLEYYGECFCGATVGGSLSAQSECNAPCTGNSSEICGGTSYISIYQDTTFPAVNDSVITDYNYVGCYSEGVGGRALEYQQDLNTSTITIEECLFACKAGGFAFAGVEYASQCFCNVVLGNGSVPLPASSCNMPCNGNTSEICGGASTLNLYVAPDLESDQPCGFVTVSSSTVSSSSTAPPSTSSTTSSTTSTTSSTPTTSSTVSTTPTTSPTTSTTSIITTSSSTKSTTSCTTSTTHTTSTTCTTSSHTTTTKSTSSPPPTTTSSKTVSLCTSTVVSTPTPTCEYQCGSWCSKPLPPFSDHPSCITAASSCAVQVFSCFLNAGWPASQDCWAFSTWCSSVSSYCSSSCPGGDCNLGSCKSKWPPVGPPPPPTSSSTTVYTCTPTTTLSKSTTTSSKSTTSSCIPIPTQSCICSQPSNPKNGYSSSSPVGSISLPCLTCNNLYSDYSAGNHFKLYTHPDSGSCSSYPHGSVPQGCQDSCDYQKQACLGTYAEGCKSNTAKQIAAGADSYASACTKCENQWNDCYSQNAGVNEGNRCSGWNSGWS
ncbi:WSC-domain-containing protein [Hyaloscypha variabilis F]|uniref:WSC-domain-containing protein n=1 Tax=Hyaloscypha variabilis (strain UAMH 11265 / GT02V1 / F) TaxID=1149755 RepID=A0A2J6SDF5_HYAVF|nr:WSC-domain-containing protein [Hyaloscypha variabilis F]